MSDDELAKVNALELAEWCGVPVTIIWHKNTDDWQWYTMRAVDERLGFILLEPRDAPDGGKNTNSPFWARLNLIDFIL
jgi:hypothetical protein